MLHSGYRIVRLVLLYVLTTCALMTANESVVFAQSRFLPSASRDTLPPARRWIDIEAFSISTRYRVIRNAGGSIADSNNQFQFLFRGKFKFDRRGKYAIGAVAATGNSFTSGWNNTGWGKGRSSANIFLKQLYFEAKPTSAVTIQVGGISISNGINTEITGYDNDNFITGERLIITSPKRFYFNQISVTNAYIGDFNKPDVFRRFRRIADANYQQLQFLKQFGNGRVSLSADYTLAAGTSTLRQAVRFAVRTKLVDSVLFEDYERLGRVAAYGFGVTLEKRFAKRLTIDGGFARLDRPMLNADRFPAGNRLFLTGRYDVSGELSVNTAFIQEVGSLSPTLPRTRFEFILSYDILATLRRLKIQ